MEENKYCPILSAAEDGRPRCFGAQKRALPIGPDSAK